MDDSLLAEAKRLAADEGITLTSLLETALREMLERRRSNRSRERIPLPTFAGRGLQPGVDLDDTAALTELMENDRGAPV